MTVPISNIDDQTYRQLRQALIDEIPLLSHIAAKHDSGDMNRSWVDHNASDPGIALLELLSAMGEMITYRCNQIPPEVETNFLKLVLDRPEPVTTEVRFVRAVPSVALASLPPGFPPAGLAALFYYEGARLLFRGVMEESQLSDLLALSANAAYQTAIQYLYAASNRTVTIPAGTQLADSGGTTEIFETIRRVTISSGKPSVDVTARHRALDPGLPKQLVDGSGATIQSDGTANQTFSLDTRTANGAVWPVLLDPSRQGSNVYDPNPRVMVSYTPEAGLPVTESWTYRQDLLEATNVDNVFTIDWLTYQLRFGDNQHGRIPPRGASFRIEHLQRVEGRERQKAVQYINSIGQTCAALSILPGGVDLSPFSNTTYDPARGQIIQSGRLIESDRDALLALDADTDYQNAIHATFETSNLNIGNPADQPVDIGTTQLFGSGGDYLFDLDNALSDGLSELKGQERAITATDFERLACDTFNSKILYDGPRVERVHARRLNDAGTVAIIIIPEASPNERRPLPTKELLQRINQFLDRRRLITTRVMLSPPIYRTIPVSVGVDSRIVYDEASLAEEIVKRIREYFHPLYGGDDGKGWKLGRSIYCSDIFQLLHQIEKVNYVWRVQLGEGAERDYFALQPLELPYMKIATSDVAVGPGS